MSLQHIKKVIEACLLTANEIIDLRQLTAVFDEQIPPATIELIITEIQNDYADKGIELIKVASGYRFRSRPEFQN